MKITDMTDILFEREMQKLLGQLQIWCVKLSRIGNYSIEPTPINNGINKYLFPFAADLKEVWDYAKGVKPQPYHLHDTIQALMEFIWAPVGSSTYTVPNTWFNEPLGFMCKLALAREELDAGNSLNTEQLALLSGYVPSRIRKLCQSGDLPATKVEQGRNSQLEWSISPSVARNFLKKRDL